VAFNFTKFNFDVDAFKEMNMPNRPPGVPRTPKDRPGKRKLNTNANQSEPKRQRITIPVQTLDQAFADGQVDVNQFVRAREYEIKALENGIRASKKELSTRAFQEVPRSLRRRTASHNVARVPKRLRVKARRQVGSDEFGTQNSWLKFAR
jgi:ribonuclease P/MRP protein subunit POP1